MKTVGLVTALCCATIYVAPASAASIVNGGFEAGSFSGWTTTGQADVVGTVGTPTIAPPSGVFQATATTAGGASPFSASVTSTPAASLESFFGLTTGALNGLRSPNAVTAVVTGSGFYQDVVVAAGDTLSFDWNFLTRENATQTSNNDFSFVVFGGSASRLVAANDSAFGPLTGSAEVIDSYTYRSSGFKKFTTTFANAGMVRIGVGAVNVGDDVFNSAIIADNFTLVSGAVPEPATWAMMLIGFGGIGFAMRRRKSKVTTTVAYA